MRQFKFGYENKAARTMVTQMMMAYALYSWAQRRHVEPGTILINVISKMDRGAQDRRMGQDFRKACQHGIRLLGPRLYQESPANTLAQLDSAMKLFGFQRARDIAQIPEGTFNGCQREIGQHDWERSGSPVALLGGLRACKQDVCKTHYFAALLFDVVYELINYARDRGFERHQFAECVRAAQQIIS